MTEIPTQPPPPLGSAAFLKFVEPATQVNGLAIVGGLDFIGQGFKEPDHGLVGGRRVGHQSGNAVFVGGFGLMVLHLLEELGRFFYVAAQTFLWMVRPPFEPREWLKQMVRVGYDSIPVVFLTTMFTGMVLALQTYRGFERFHAEGFVGSVVALSLIFFFGHSLLWLLRELHEKLRKH